MATGINFNYKQIDGTFRPIIPVEIINPKTENSIKHAVLIDSGADWCVINAEIGEAIGLKIVNKKQHKFKGISGKEEIGYVHNIKMKIKEVNYNVPVIFSKALAEDRYSIVGQIGFFDQFDIRFNWNRREIVLRPIYK